VGVGHHAEQPVQRPSRPRRPGGAVRALADIADRSLLDELFRRRRFDAGHAFRASCIQVAARCSIRPAKYCTGNDVVKILDLLDAMTAFGIDKFIFSSTGGKPSANARVRADRRSGHPQQPPINPDGRSKRMIEQALADDAAKGLRAGGREPARIQRGRCGSRWRTRRSGRTRRPTAIPLVLQAASRVGARACRSSAETTTPPTAPAIRRRDIHIVDSRRRIGWRVQSLLDGAPSQAIQPGQRRWPLRCSR
jgi:hypothetical protein